MVTKKKTVKSGTTIHYTVSAPDYITQEGDIYMDSDKTLNITLQQVEPDPPTPPTPTEYWAEWDYGTSPSSINAITIGGQRYFSLTSPIKKEDYDGNMTSFSLYNNNRVTKVTTLDTQYLSSFISMFQGCTKLTSIPQLDSSNVSSFQNMFNGCSSITSIPSFDTSNGTAFNSMFSGCSKLTSIPTLDTSNGTNFSNMFYGCTALTTIPTLDMGKAENIDYMFSGCTSLTTLGGLTNIGKGFTSVKTLNLSQCPNLTERSVLNVIDGLYNMTGTGIPPTLQLTQDMVDSLSESERAFVAVKGWILLPEPTPVFEGNWAEWDYGTTGFYMSGYDFSTKLGTTSWYGLSSPIKKSDYRQYLRKLSFGYNDSLTTVSSIDGTYLNSAQYMFYGCTNLTSIPEFNTKNVTDFSNMLYNCSSLTTIPLLDTSNGTNFYRMFYGCSALTTIPMLNTGNGTDFSWMFSGCSSLTSTYIPTLNTSNGTDFSNMFSGCSRITTISLLDTSNGTDFSAMFSRCTNLTTISQLNTSNGTDFSGMFTYCSNLTSIPLLDTSNGTNFYRMFSNCSSLTTIPQLKTGNGTDFRGMFGTCSNLTSIPELDCSNGTSFDGEYSGDYMFIRCTSLTTVGGLTGLRYSVSFGDSPLTHQSALNVLNKLGTAADSSQAITFKASTYNTLTADEIKIATDKGWQVVSA